MELGRARLRDRRGRTRRQRSWPVDMCFIFIVFGAGWRDSRVVPLGESGAIDPLFPVPTADRKCRVLTSRRSVLTPAQPARTAAPPPQPAQAPVPPTGPAQTGIPRAGGGAYQGSPIVWNNHFLHPATIAAYPRLRSLNNNHNNHHHPQTYTPPSPALAPRRSSLNPSAGNEQGSSQSSAVTPLTSQPPSIFTSISGQKETESTTKAGPSSIGSGAEAETPAQMAAAAAMRRLQKWSESSNSRSDGSSQSVPEITTEPEQIDAAPPPARSLSYLTPLAGQIESTAPIFLATSLPEDAPKPFLTALDALMKRMRMSRKTGGKEEVLTQLNTLTAIEDKLAEAMDEIVVERSILIAGEEWDSDGEGGGS